MNEPNRPIFMGWMSLPFAEQREEIEVATNHTEDCVHTGQAQWCNGMCLGEAEPSACTDCGQNEGTNPHCFTCTVGWA